MCCDFDKNGQLCDFFSTSYHKFEFKEDVLTCSRLEIFPLRIWISIRWNFFLCVFNDFIRWNFVHRPRCVASPPLFFFSFFLVKKNQSTRKKMKEEEITQPMKRFLLFSLWWKRGNVLHQMSALWRVNEAGPRGFPIRHGAAKVIFRFIFLFFPFYFGVSLPCFFLFFLFIFA